MEGLTSQPLTGGHGSLQYSKDQMYDSPGACLC